jgi:AraC-like DNA-binding protein
MNGAEYSALSRSRSAQKTLRALMELTDLPIRLMPFDSAQRQNRIPCPTSPLCRLLFRTMIGRCACDRFLDSLQARLGPERTSATAHCAADLTALAVPVRVAGLPVAMLLCGGCLPRKQSTQDYARRMRRLRRLGLRLNPARAKHAYHHTRALPPSRLRAVVQVLRALAEHLGELAGHYLLSPQTQDPPCVASAKAFTRKHLAEKVKTRDAAHEAHVSEEYFCRVFKEATGMTFSEYVARARIEQAKQLLTDPKLRVTEVAFAAGFQSIPHFNHTFKRHNGTSPKEYRARLKS